MNRVELRHIPLRPPGLFMGLRTIIAAVGLSLFLVSLAWVWAGLWLRLAWLPRGVWPEATLLALAALTTLLSLARQLPGQNVLLAGTLIVFASGAAESLNAVTGIPLGPCIFTEQAGRQVFYVVPWIVPLLWMVSLLNSRGVARLVLRPWRQMRNYGFWLLGLTVMLAMLLDLGLQPFAIKVMHYWSWLPTRLPTNWYGAPWVSFLGRGVTMLLLMAFVTPMLLNKKPVTPLPEYQPLVVWSAINVLFFTGAVVGRLWAAAVLTGLGTLLTVGLALWESRRPKLTSSPSSS